MRHKSLFNRHLPYLKPNAIIKILAKIKIHFLNQFLDIISVLLTLNNGTRIKSVDKYVVKRKWCSRLFNKKQLRH